MQQIEEWFRSEDNDYLDEPIPLDTTFQPSMTNEDILDFGSSGKESPCLEMNVDAHIDADDFKENSTVKVKSCQQAELATLNPLPIEQVPEKKSILSALYDAKESTRASYNLAAATSLNIIGGSLVIAPVVYYAHTGFAHNCYEQQSINTSSYWLHPNLVNNTEEKIKSNMEAKSKEACQDSYDKQSETKKRKRPERILLKTPHFRKKKKEYDLYTQSFSFLKPE
jgi:hypothetical protein